MKLVVLAPIVLGTALASTAAGAQGYDSYGDGGFAPPSMVPEAAPLPPPPPPMRRFSVGVGFGHTGLAPHSAPDAQTDFGLGELAVRYLAGRHFELELALAGGTSQNEDGTDGGLELSEAVLSLRYRFSPQRRWNWWLSAGMGSLSVTRVGATDDEAAALTQSTLQFGIGIERRWTRFSIQADLRAVGVAKNEDVMETSSAITGTTADGKKGGQFALTGNYYF